MMATWRAALLRIMRVGARPIREAQGEEGIVLEPYRGYGSKSEVFLIGRVFRQSQATPGAKRDLIRTYLRDIARRIVRRALPGAAVTVRFYGAEETFTTDRDGYFR